MHIQWFPGHMTSALRMMEDNLKLVDCVIYILDARAVNASKNPYLEKLIFQKPQLILLNKADMADAVITKKWIKSFAENGKLAVETNATSPKISNLIIAKLNELLSEKIENNKARGVKRTLRAMIVGIPNCGKSTIINSLAKAKKAQVGDRPGVTRAKQWIRLGEGYELLDTPGTLWNSFEDQKLARHLAYIGSISDVVVDMADLALEFIAEIKDLDKTIFEKRYDVQIETDDTPLIIFDKICQKRGYLISKGNYDYDRAGKAIIDDFRKNRLGRISLDVCE